MFFANFDYIYPPMVYMVGKPRISASIWHQAIEIWSILQAVRISVTDPDRLLNSSWHCVLSSFSMQMIFYCWWCGVINTWFLVFLIVDDVLWFDIWLILIVDWYLIVDCWWYGVTDIDLLEVRKTSHWWRRQSAGKLADQSRSIFVIIILIKSFITNVCHHQNR